MKKILIGCDLFLDEYMYSLPIKYKKKIKINFPNVEIIPINIENTVINNKIDIYWGNRINQKIFKQCPNIKWIHFGSVGVDRLQNLKIKNKILISNSQNIMNKPMVASILSYIFSLTRGLNFLFLDKISKKLSRKNYDLHKDIIQDCFGMSCLIVGFGSIARDLSKILSVLDMKLDAISRKKIKHKLINKFFNLKDLKKIIRNYDIVINLLPKNQDTKNIFNRTVFKKMKKTSFYINVGRGNTNDEEDLYLALKNKNIAGAALDVFKNEPLKKNSKFYDLNNLILSPHVASFSKKYWELEVKLFEHNLKLFLQKKYYKMNNIIDYK